MKERRSIYKLVSGGPVADEADDMCGVNQIYPDSSNREKSPTSTAYAASRHETVPTVAKANVVST